MDELAFRSATDLAEAVRPGPLTRSADDLDLLLGLMAGPSARDSAAWRLDLPEPRHSDLRDYRVAAWIDDEACAVDGEVVDMLDGAVSALEAAGVPVDRTARPDLDLATTSKLGMQLIVAATSVSMSPEEIDGLAEQSRGAAILTQRHHAWLERERLRTEVRAIWDRSYGELMTWTGFIGMAYLPVTTPPIGPTASGLPTSVQVVAPYLHDRSAIDFGRRLAELTGTGYRPPRTSSSSSRRQA